MGTEREIYIATSILAPHVRTTQHTQNLPNDLAAALFFATRRTLNRTVFDRGRHWPVHFQVNIYLVQGYRSVRTNSNNITNLYTESWRYMGSKVLVSLLVTV